MADPNTTQHPNAPQTPQQQQAAQRAAEEQRKQTEAAHKEAEAVIDARTKYKDAQVKAAAEREAATQPTPTPREIDLAKMGVHVEEKEDDGSESPEEYEARILKERAENPYTTRDVQAKRRERTQRSRR